MNLMELMAYHQEQYEELKRLNDNLLAQKEISDTGLELFLLERERCIVQMQLKPLLTVERMQMEELAKSSDDELEPATRAMLQQYQLLKGLNRQVVNQDQAVAMKLRSMAKENEKQKPQKKRVETYIQTLDRTINERKGGRFDRLR